MGSFADEVAAMRAATAAVKVAGATTPAPVPRPSTSTVPKKTASVAPAAPAAPAAKAAPPAAPAPAAPAPVAEEPGALRQVGLTQWLMGQPTAPTTAAAPKPATDLPLVVSEAGADAYRADEAKRLRQEDNAYYAKKLDEVAKLRKANVIGAVNVGPSWAAPESSPLIGSASKPRPATGKPGMSTDVYPRPENVYTPNEDTLASVGRFAAEAKRLGQEYRAADRDVARGAEAIEQARNDWQFDRRKLPQMALAQRERVRRLAERRASLREMGFTDDVEVDEKFLK